MPILDCVPSEVLLEFTQPDPPSAEPIETAFQIIERGFHDHLVAMQCIQDGVNAGTGTGLGDFVRTGPDTAAQNTITPTGDVLSLTLHGTPGKTSDHLRVESDLFAILARITAAGEGHFLDLVIRNGTPGVPAAGSVRLYVLSDDIRALFSDGTDVSIAARA